MIIKIILYIYLLLNNELNQLKRISFVKFDKFAVWRKHVQRYYSFISCFSCSKIIFVSPRLCVSAFKIQFSGINFLGIVAIFFERPSTARCISVFFVFRFFFLELNAKHIHAPKLADIQFVTPSFLPPCMCLTFNSKKNHL